MLFFSIVNNVHSRFNLLHVSKVISSWKIKSIINQKWVYKCLTSITIDVKKSIYITSKNNFF